MRLIEEFDELDAARLWLGLRGLPTTNFELRPRKITTRNGNELLIQELYIDDDDDDEHDAGAA